MDSEMLAVFALAVLVAAGVAAGAAGRWRTRFDAVPVRVRARRVARPQQRPR